MQIKINANEYTLHFGWSFLEEINNVFGVRVEVDGNEMNTRAGGLTFLENGLERFDPITVAKAIKAGTNTYKNQPQFKDIQSYVEGILVKDSQEYVDLAKGILEEIKKEPMLKALNNLKV